MEALVDSNSVNPDPQFWCGRRVALTGHTGFKGCWMALVLHRLGAKVFGFALAPSTRPNLYDEAGVEHILQSTIGDIRDCGLVSQWMDEIQPEIVFHFAAQALVRESYRDPVATMQTNFIGTMNLLEAVRQQPSVKAVVVVTTDKVYKNEESAQSFQEDDPLGGHDPYSASKAACEILIASYRTSFLGEIGVASARAGNVIGGGDWSPDRLIPDAVRAWTKNKVLEIRRPDAVRPWQHVLEPVCGYLVLAQRLYSDKRLSQAYNFGPLRADTVRVRDVVVKAQTEFGLGQVEFSDGLSGPHEANFLHLNVKRVQAELGVVPRWYLSCTIQKTMQWYRAFALGENARSLCESDIEQFLL